MPSIELSAAQQAVLRDTQEVADPAQFRDLLARAKPEMSRIVGEIMEPNQALSVTTTEFRDLYFTVTAHTSELAKVNYGPDRITLFRDAIRLAATADLWFGEGTRTGQYRTRTVEEVVAASRPWRARLRAFGAQAFAFQPDIADKFADVNSTGTLDEEVTDLRTLNALIADYKVPLASVGLTPKFALDGAALLDEASGRDLLGILGLHDQEEAITMRNRIMTYATLLATEARAAGVNACFDDPDARRRFEAASFRSAVRRLRPRRKRPAQADAPAETTTDPVATTEPVATAKPVATTEPVATAKPVVLPSK